ncbi:hypothetical protein VNO80_25307 [Phaseolus coccineus]|uniref:Uncharacterized protein n=1 Tax=Phaseolus coccineus TaxID=3886 RepID=A0AAN9LYC7_PHACN
MLHPVEAVARGTIQAMLSTGRPALSRLSRHRSLTRWILRSLHRYYCVDGGGYNVTPLVLGADLQFSREVQVGLLA